MELPACPPLSGGQPIEPSQWPQGSRHPMQRSYLKAASGIFYFKHNIIATSRLYGEMLTRYLNPHFSQPDDPPFGTLTLRGAVDGNVGVYEVFVASAFEIAKTKLRCRKKAPCFQDSPPRQSLNTPRETILPPHPLQKKPGNLQKRRGRRGAVTNDIYPSPNMHLTSCRLRTTGPSRSL